MRSLVGALPLIFAVMQLSSAAFADDSGMQIVVAGDLLGRFDLGGSDAPDRFDVRGVEAGFYGPIDQTFDGLISFAAHPASEGLGVELHEATITASRLPAPFQVKAGQFFLGVGRLNQTHQHDWSIVTTPKIHTLIFQSSEGALDTGGELTWLAPFLPATIVKLGVTNGWVFGHSHVKGMKPRKPLLYARVTLFGDAELLRLRNASSGLLLGCSLMMRRPDRKDSPEFDVIGADLTLKIREGRRLVWHWQSESWMRWLRQAGGAEESVWGAWTYLERHIWDRLSLGFRADLLADLSREDILGRPETDEKIDAGIVMTWRNSEFQTLKLEYLYETAQVQKNHTHGQSVAVQTTFLLGAHPAHDF